MHALQSRCAEPGSPAKPIPENMAMLSFFIGMQVRRGKALDLMASGWPPHLESPNACASSEVRVRARAYDAHHVLSLCRLHAFQEGLVFLYDKMRLAREVLQGKMRLAREVLQWPYIYRDSLSVKTKRGLFS
eukprot:scaffold4768_cov19-Tisochrysis_lutea.AAC.3